MNALGMKYYKVNIRNTKSVLYQRVNAEKPKKRVGETILT
jgi:hypothetical protein